jgi:formimidoylglutamate deiminase
MKYLAPEYVYTPQGVQSRMLIAISNEGRIVSVAGFDSSSPASPGMIKALPNMLLLPGFVNTHSHVFQRALRGHTHRPFSTHDSFWTWRRAMYIAANQLNPDNLYEVALRTYREMLQAGYTSVGEFHYIHHQPDGRSYANPNIMAEAVLSAGRDAGIRVVLLLTAYAQGGINQSLEQAQRRFCDASVDAYLARIDALEAAGVPVGVAPHSVRAVPESWIRPIAVYSRSHALPLHIHADEQQAEIEQCRQVYGCTPIELLQRYGVLGPRTSIIHATHANEVEIALLQQEGCTVCVCPTTEADLGDGIAPYAELVAAEIPLAIGSDSNTRLDPFEELRWAEYSARMRYERRRILVRENHASLGSFLLDMGTHRGASALGLDTGVIAPGMLADLIAIDLNHPMLQGWNVADLLDVLFFGASSEVVKQVWVAGEEVCL